MSAKTIIFSMLAASFACLGVAIYLITKTP